MIKDNGKYMFIAISACLKYRIDSIFTYLHTKITDWKELHNGFFTMKYHDQVYTNELNNLSYGVKSKFSRYWCF